jgi:hypothetical protein
MQNNRLGCFSLSAIITALLTLAAIVGTAFARGNGMFSPGALNATEGAVLGGVSSHAATGGECGACHVAPWSVERMADRCADCHLEIVSDMSKIAQAHGAMLHDDPDLSCAHCHPEHRGPSALLTLEGARADFPHDVMGYSLSGHALTVARAPFVCEDCHIQNIQQFDQAACEDCHRQIDPVFTQAHALSWGKDCLACHDGVDTYSRHFDHGKVPFALTGAHVEVDCYTCHTDARALVDLRNTPQDCSTCHRDDEPHEGRFGADCAECHSMDAWIPAKFDHNLAAFKLEGRHIEVDCGECHKTKPYRGTPMECFACHEKDDEHAGKFDTECGACHKPTGWDDSPFDHNKSNFPLVAGHADVACGSCHKDKQYAGTSTTCVSCHGYPGWHGTAFGANCLSCHNNNNWGNAKYTLGHPWFSHPKEGVGMGSCRSCHPSSVFESDCSSCHKGGFGD